MKVAISKPKDGATVSGKIPFEAVLSGDTTALDRVEFRIDAVVGQQNPWLWIERIAPFQYGGDNGFLDTSKLPDGRHKLGVRAIDRKGVNVSNAVVYVTVKNKVAPPPPTLKVTIDDGGAHVGHPMTGSIVAA